MAIGIGDNDPTNLPTTGGGTGPTYGGAGEVPPSLLNAMRGSLPGQYAGETMNDYWSRLGSGPDYGAPFTNGNNNRPISYDSSGNPTYAPYLQGQGTPGTRIASTVLNQYGVATPGATPGADGTGSGGRPPPGAPMYYAGYQGGAGNEAQMQSSLGAERAQGYMGMGAANYDQMGAMGRTVNGMSAMIGNGWNATGNTNQGGMADLAGQYNGLSGYVYRNQADQDYGNYQLDRLRQLAAGNQSGIQAGQNFTSAQNYGAGARLANSRLYATEGAENAFGNQAGSAASGNQMVSRNMLGNAQGNQYQQGAIQNRLQGAGAYGEALGAGNFGTSQGFLNRTNQDYGAQAGARNQTENALGRLQNFYQQGPGPSAAQAQLQMSGDQNMANAIALARSGRGAGDNSAAMRQAIFSNAATQQQLGGQMANLRANEEATWRGQQLSAMGQEQGALNNLRGQDITAGGQAIGAAQGFAGLGYQGTGQNLQALEQAGSQNLQQQGMNLSSAGQFAGLGYQGMGLQAGQLNQVGSQQLGQMNALLGAQNAQGQLGYQGLGQQQAAMGQVSQQDLSALGQNNQIGLNYAQLGQGYQQMGLNNQLAYNQMANQNYMQGLTLQQQYQLAGMQNQINYAQLANQQYSSSDQLRAQILNAQLQADTAKYGADRGVQVGMAQIQQQQQAAQMAMYGALGAGAIGLLSDIRSKKNIRKPEGLLEKVFGLKDNGDDEDAESRAPAYAPPPPNPYAPPPREVPLPGSPSFERPVSPFAGMGAPGAPAIPPPGTTPQQTTIPIDFTRPPPGSSGPLPGEYNMPNNYWQNLDDAATGAGYGYSLGPGPAMPQYGWQPNPPLSDERSKQAMYRLGQLAGMKEANAPGVDLRPAQGYSYEYKNPAAPGAAPGRQYGPMAQDLERTPAGASVVQTDPHTGLKSIDTDRLSLVNTAAQSESQRRIDRLEQLAGLRKAG